MEYPKLTEGKLYNVRFAWNSGIIDPDYEFVQYLEGGWWLLKKSAAVRIVNPAHVMELYPASPFFA